MNMDYLRVAALEISVLHPRDRRWLLKQIPIEQRRVVKSYLAELSKLGKGHLDELVAQAKDCLREEHAQQENPVTGIERSSLVIAAWSDETAKAWKPLFSTNLAHALFHSENWKWLDVSGTPERNFSLSPMVRNTIVELLTEHGDRG